MNSPINALLEKEKAKHDKAQLEECALLAELIQGEQYVGETLKMDYREVVIQVNDFFRRKVGGIPHLSYLVASRLKPDGIFNPDLEDSSVLLLRVLGSAPMPSDSMDIIVRAEAARRATGREHHWDAQQVMDGYTRNELNYAGLVCEIVGTFFLFKKADGATELRFGTDLSNFYPNTGLKVYKPINKALETIVNFRDLGLSPNHPLQNFTVNIGSVRYASSNRNMQGVDNVQVSIAPMDLLAQRSALFGMSRTGKSNTTKIIARAIYRLRLDATNPVRVGQLIMDYNGEYANENTQGGNNVVANALKNVYLEHGGNTDEVVTYGLTRPRQDPNRRLLQINAYGNEIRDWNDLITTTEDLDMLQVGKVILSDLLDPDPAKYIKNFLEVDLSVPDGLKDYGVQSRYRRQILVYRALLARAGLPVPAALSNPTSTILLGAGGKALFRAELLTKMNANGEPKFARAAKTLAKTSGRVSWDELGNAFENLAEFISQKDSGYADFNADYLARHSKSGQSWADPNLLRLLEMFRYPNGSKAVARLEKNHEPNTIRDFAEQIYDDLKSGKLVIVDQSGGDPLLNDAAAKRIMWAIFKGNQKAFTSGDTPPDLLVYVEEAHNLLPNSSDLDLRDVWVRTAKEGSKYRIGLVYATQGLSLILTIVMKLKSYANFTILRILRIQSYALKIEVSCESRHSQTRISIPYRLKNSY
jgi:Helicase HerA, central domain